MPRNAETECGMNIIIGSATHVVVLTDGFYAHTVKEGGGCKFKCVCVCSTSTLGIFHLFFFFFSVLPINP